MHAIHETDVCVIGGGMAGLAAALSAARHGAEVLLMHDRPVLGGNASSECRVHICGADRNCAIPNARETGILEELRLDNLRFNPQRSFSLWDAVLYDAARREPRLTLLLNCSCLQAEMDGRRIVSASGWQATTYARHQVRSKVFIDCSGDAVLAPLTGACYRFGREGRDEYRESLAPRRPDRGTMGMTLAFAARRHETAQPFTPPAWAHRYERCEDLPGRHDWLGRESRAVVQGYWWVELGGLADGIADTERLRDELLAVVYGVWDHIKNRGHHGADNWALEWVQFLPAKRESRRYVGRHVLTQQEVLSGGRFDDVVAYGGWTIDEHPPAGFLCGKLGLRPAYHASPPVPYGIPYGVLVARDVENLMFAGRCASCTHIAMSSTRVMGTATVMGQAAGTAAALAVRRGIDPAGVSSHIDELQQSLLGDDAYLPGVPQRFSRATTQAKLKPSRGDPRPLRDGVNRPVGAQAGRDASRLEAPADEHAWHCGAGDWLEMHFPVETVVRRLTLIADSALDRKVQMSFWDDAGEALSEPPESLLRDARVEVLTGSGWTAAGQLRDNHQRLVRIGVDRRAQALRVTIERTRGAEQTRLFAAYVE